MVELLNNVLPKPRADQIDPYVQDLEVVEFEIDGEVKTFVGGKFGTAPFFVAAHTFNGGRRLKVDNMPNADTNIIQDLGRKTRGINFTYYLLGSDILKQKQLLIDEMESGGEKELVHPYFGRFRARGGDISLTEVELIKRYATGSLAFEIINDSITQKTSVNREKALAAAVDDSNSALLAAFETVFETAGKAQGVVEAANDAVLNALDAVESARDSLRSVAAFKEKLREIRTNIGILLDSPSELGNALLDLVSFEDEDNDDRDYRSEQQESFVSARFTNTTANTQIQSESDRQIVDNDNAVNSIIKQGSANQAAKIVPFVGYESVNDAASSIQTFIDTFEDSRLYALDADSYYLSLNVITQSTDYISSISDDLAQVETIELNRPVDVLSLTYELYGSSVSTPSEFVPDVIKRNLIKDPFFALGELEVLTS